MTKYIITSGRVVLSTIVNEDDSILIQLSNKAIPEMFDTIGEAMEKAAKVNELVGRPCFRVEPIQVENI